MARKRHNLFLSGCHAIASANNSSSFLKNISLHQSNKSANIEWNLLQTVDDMVLKLANFLCKLQLVWDPFWIVLSLHYTSCITPLTKLSFADVPSMAWWIKQTSWFHVNSLLFELDTQYDCIWIWEIWTKMYSMLPRRIKTPLPLMCQSIVSSITLNNFLVTLMCY